jgi:heme-degrading monooxygenase HmoA
MIVRTWSARAKRAGGYAYRDYFEQTLLPELRGVAGFAGGYLLLAEQETGVELTTHTFWESIEAIKAFAGEDINAAVVEPEARAVLLHIDATVTHRTVLVDDR